jgi:type II secretory pathway pseudopilin PulG
LERFSARESGGLLFKWNLQKRRNFDDIRTLYRKQLPVTWNQKAIFSSAGRYLSHFGRTFSSGKLRKLCQRMHNMIRISQNTGFTILEVMVSIIILTLSLLLLLNMAMVALEGNDWSSKTTASTQLLQEKLEDLRNDLSVTSGVDTVNNIERNWQITNEASHLRRIDITASWRNRRGDVLQNSITAFVRTDSI